jgi:hypothetical protein
MKPTRQTQPYRGGNGIAGPAKTAMNRGRQQGMTNPADRQRMLIALAKRLARKSVR